MRAGAPQATPTRRRQSWQTLVKTGSCGIRDTFSSPGMDGRSAGVKIRTTDVPAMLPLCVDATHLASVPPIAIGAAALDRTDAGSAKSSTPQVYRLVIVGSIPPPSSAAGPMPMCSSGKMALVHGFLAAADTSHVELLSTGILIVLLTECYLFVHSRRPRRPLHHNHPLRRRRSRRHNPHAA